MATDVAGRFGAEAAKGVTISAVGAVDTASIAKNADTTAILGKATTAAGEAVAKGLEIGGRAAGGVASFADGAIAINAAIEGDSMKAAEHGTMSVLGTLTLFQPEAAPLTIPTILVIDLVGFEAMSTAAARPPPPAMRMPP